MAPIKSTRIEKVFVRTGMKPEDAVSVASTLVDEVETTVRESISEAQERHEGALDARFATLKAQLDARDSGMRLYLVRVIAAILIPSLVMVTWVLSEVLK
jgi:hypothetical protein